jgi:hypothetical protein
VSRVVARFTCGSSFSRFEANTEAKRRIVVVSEMGSS